MSPISGSVTILVPTRDRPRELARLLNFLAFTGNTFPVRVLDGSTREVRALNAATVGRFDFAVHDSHDPELHLGLRCADGLRKISTPYVVFCADDDFVFPQALTQCAAFLNAHADHSVASGNFLSLNYLPDQPVLKNGVLLADPFRFIGYTAHAHFLQRALYFFAYSYLGTPPLYYGLRRTDSAREAFYHLNAGLKYSGVELLSSSIALIRGKVAVLELPFGLRDYSCPTTMEPLRHDPETYLATADVAYIRPILVAALADAENLPVDLAEKYIDLHLTQWQPPDWVAPHLATLKVDLWAKVKMALALLRSMLSADTMARRHGLPVSTVRALLCAQRQFIRDRR